jgi:GNAT superfamily N-acetyltransferase
MIRPSRADDVPILIALARETGVFKPIEIGALEEVLGDYLKKPGGEGYHAYTFEDAGDVLGFACHGPNTMTERTWDLYWIAVARVRQQGGIGTRLLEFVEADIRRQHGRLIMVETSSLPAYDATRRFYRKHGYEEVAVVPDFYADGDSLVLFQKRLPQG